MEKYEKDIILTQNFATDFNNAHAQENKEMLLLSLTTAPFTVMLLIFFLAIEIVDLKICIGIILFLLLSGFAILFITKFKNHKLSKAIKNTDYTIVTAKVIERYQEILPTKYRRGRPNILVFSQYGNFMIPEGISFSTAKKFSMRETEFFRTSKIGDTFYLVLDNQNNILLAYNTRFFELQE